MWAVFLMMAVLVGPVELPAVAAPVATAKAELTSAALEPGSLRLVTSGVQQSADTAVPAIDTNIVYLSCMAGVSLAALYVAMPPIYDWTNYDGWIPGMWAIASRGLLGCYYGMVLGILYSGAESGVDSMLRGVQGLWPAETVTVAGPGGSS